MSLAVKTSLPLAQRITRSTQASSAGSYRRVEGENSPKILQVFGAKRPEERRSKAIVLGRDFSKKEISQLTPISSALNALPKPYNEETLERIKALHPDVALTDIANLAAQRQSLLNIGARNGLFPKGLAESLPSPVQETKEKSAPIERVRDAGSVASFQNAISRGLLLEGGLVRLHDLKPLLLFSKDLTKEDLDSFSQTERPIVEGWLTNVGIRLY